MHGCFGVSRVKFGAFYEYLDSQYGPRFDRVASGHYARVLRDVQNPNGLVSLALTPDLVKDQTYFLAHLTQQQLARTMFPLGPLTKVSASLGTPGVLSKKNVP
jgi:tRNA-specific 2-thiouridylase